jgi:quercetin dioxygenase-like cupin family protein
VAELFGSVDLRLKISEPPAYDVNKRATRTVLDFEGIKALLVWMRKGTKWAEHRTQARITVHTLKGGIRLRAQENIFELPENHLLGVQSNVPHDVEALEDSMFLLTLTKPTVGAREDQGDR